MKIAFQGEHGAYSEIACKSFESNCETIPCKTFKDVFDSVENGKTEKGVIPVENSLTGDIFENWDLLSKYDFFVSAELFLPINHCLIGNSELGKITKIYSHPQALSQSEKFLSKINAEKIPVYDTAGAVMIVKERGRQDEAAVASELAATTYGMKIISRIIPESENMTRFFLLSKDAATLGKNMKTSLIFAADHKPGSLFRCLEGFAENKVNLTRITSRPMRSGKWKYIFYLDFLGGLQDENVMLAMDTLRINTEFIKIIGCYPAAKEI